MKWMLFLFTALPTVAADFSELVRDREAVERVYYSHRTGEKPPFEETLSREQIRNLVERDLVKEAVLKRRYRLEISEAQVAAEIARINSTTRAPETLVEVKAALGEDPYRFACSVAKPLLVERALRERFENDAELHAPQRREIERVRENLLRAKAAGASAKQLLADFKQAHRDDITETTFQLSARRGEAQKSPRTSYFNELPGQLQTVLRAQLHQAGNISAVIEMPDTFVLYVAKEMTAEALTVLTFSLPKRSYEQFLTEQGAVYLPLK
jgi:hypothetical protein